MKKIINNLPVLVVLAVVAFAIGFSDMKSPSMQAGKISVERTVPNTTVEINSKSGFVKVNPFSPSQKDYRNTEQVVKAYSSLNLNVQDVNSIVSSKPSNIEFAVTKADGKQMNLKLTQKDVVSDDFMMTEISETGEKPFAYKKGAYYRGVIEGDNNSIAAVSFFDGFAMGVIANSEGNFVLGPMNNDANSQDYILYNDADMTVSNKFKCAVDDHINKLAKHPQTSNSQNNNGQNQTDGGAVPLRVYFECDYQFYLDNGSNLQSAGNFLTGMYNVVANLYQNEGLGTVISKASVYSSADPYRNYDDSFDILKVFGARNQDNVVGHVGHLISTRLQGGEPVLGGIAWINVLCQPYSAPDSAGRFAFSNIEPDFNNLPTYSWTVNVVTHELGHSLGSFHTHSCHWPTNFSDNGAIDSCYDAEPDEFNNYCFNQPRPRVGTIMSYCHLWSGGQGGGINLSSGFGHYPGDTIRRYYNASPCITSPTNSSEVPVQFTVLQNTPNPFNPSTTIRFGLPENGYVTITVYDVAGRLVTSLIEGEFKQKGIYSTMFNASGLTSGVYFYRVELTSTSGVRSQEIKKMILVK